MALSAFIGSVTTPTVTGNYSVAGVGFQPSLMLTFNNSVLGVGSTRHGDLSIGFVAGNSLTSIIACQNADALGTTDMTNSHWSQRAIEANDYTTGPARADLRSFDADGFSLTYGTVVTGTSYSVEYVALGGTDITNVVVGSFLVATSTGAQSVAGIGFKPNAMLFSSGVAQTGAAQASAAGVEQFMGWATSSTSQSASSWVDRDAQADGRAKSWLNSANCILKLGQLGVSNAVASLTSFDANGFTVNWSTIVAAAQTSMVYYLAVSGGQWFVGQFLQATSTGVQNVTGVGFIPGAILFTSQNKVAAVTTSNNYQTTLGAAVSATQRFSLWAGARNTSDPTEADKYLTQSNVIALLTTTATPVVSSLADFSSFDTDGFTINWSTVNSIIQPVVSFLAVGANAVGGVTTTQDLASYIFTG